MAHRIAHLPAGHQPGPQSRRVARSSPFAVMLLGVCALGFLGGAIALYAGRNSGSRSGHEVGAAVLAGAARFWGGKLVLWGGKNGGRRGAKELGAPALAGGGWGWAASPGGFPGRGI